MEIWNIQVQPGNWNNVLLNAFPVFFLRKIAAACKRGTKPYQYTVATKSSSCVRSLFSDESPWNLNKLAELDTTFNLTGFTVITIPAKLICVQVGMMSMRVLMRIWRTTTGNCNEANICKGRSATSSYGCIHESSRAIQHITLPTSLKDLHNATCSLLHTYASIIYLSGSSIVTILP